MVLVPNDKYNKRLMLKRIREYVDELVSQKVQVADDIFSYIGEDNLNKENIELFLRFIDEMYKGKDVNIFTFPFLERLDEFIQSPENIDMIKELFDIMDHQTMGDFDIISSGSFGLHIYKLIEAGEIDFKGNVVVVSGKIRKVKEDENNPIKILKKRTNDIKNKSFVFFDDSYFSGGTRDKISKFLEQFNSNIYKSFVFYTHNVEDPSDVFSIYCYSEYHKEEVMPIHKHLEYINGINLKDYEDVIWPAIKSGQVKRLRDLMQMIKRLYESEKSYKQDESFLIKYKNFAR